MSYQVILAIFGKPIQNSELIHEIDQKGQFINYGLHGTIGSNALVIVNLSAGGRATLNICNACFIAIFPVGNNIDWMHRITIITFDIFFKF